RQAARADLRAEGWVVHGGKRLDVVEMKVVDARDNTLYATGSLSTLSVTVGLGGLSLGLGAIALLRPVPGGGNRRTSRLEWLFFALPVGAASFFTLTNLGYADYWGDEMNGLLRAISVIGGRGETIFEHTKGPVEIIVPAVFGLLAGPFDPFTLRFPFALIYAAATGSVYLLARRLFNRNVGLVSALLLGINGLYLGHGRIVQYPNVVLLATCLSLLLAYRFSRGEGRYALNLSLFLVGVGTLAHYDILLALAPIGYILWQRCGWRVAEWHKIWRPLLEGGALMLATAAVFYLPFALHPHLSQTTSYLGRIIGAGNWPANNFDELYSYSLMHNSGYYLAFVALLGLATMAATLVALFRAGRGEKWLWRVTGVAIGLSVVAVVAGRGEYVPFVLSSLAFLLLAAFSGASGPLKLVYVWIGVSFIAYVFFVDHPRNHLHVIYPGWSILAALAIEWGRERAARWGRWGAVAGPAALGLALFALFAGYEYLLFVDAGREYILTYPARKTALYWEDANFPFNSRRPYGAPHRLGWQMVNYLYRQGTLKGDWDSNDDGSNLVWYTLGSPRNLCYPRYYFLTQFVQNENVDFAAPDLSYYARIGQVWNGDRLQMEVYEFAPQGESRPMQIWTEPARYGGPYSPAMFNGDPATGPHYAPAVTFAPPRRFKPHPDMLAQLVEVYNDPNTVLFREEVSLVGYDVDATRAEPGGLVIVTLYWRAGSAVFLPYKVFVHLEDTQLWAQADSEPACGRLPTYGWLAGDKIMDRHVIQLPAGMPPGEYPLQVGLYEIRSGLRMDALDEAGNPAGNALSLPPVTVR
ncbi:MAG: glycosyltransferase family 39 protein, partial [Anaerolineae bacterium]